MGTMIALNHSTAPEVRVDTVHIDQKMLDYNKLAEAIAKYPIPVVNVTSPSIEVHPTFHVEPAEIPEQKPPSVINHVRLEVPYLFAAVFVVDILVRVAPWLFTILKL